MVRTLKNMIILVFSVLLLVTMLPFSDAHASARFNIARDEHDDALKAIKRGEIMSYSQIKRAVEDRLGGRVVDIKLRRTNRGWQYFLRVSRKDGRVVAAVVDAQTARILSTR